MSTQVFSTGAEWFAQTLDSNSDFDKSVQPPGLEKPRRIARQRLREIRLPNRKQEAWRYTDLSELYKKLFYSPESSPISSLDKNTINQWVYAKNEAYRLVFANGQFQPGLSDLVSNDDIYIGNINQAPASLGVELTRLFNEQQVFADDAFSEMNKALMQDGLFIHLKANYQLDKPVEVVYLNLSSDRQLLSQPRNLVLLQPGSSLKLLERYTSADHSEYFFNGLTQIELCSDARLSHHRLQQESRNAFHLCRVALNQHGGSEYNALNLSTGAHWSRTDINARFSGEHARSTISGLYSLNDGQYNDIHLDVQHLKPNCQSKQEFKGILLGKGRAVFDGRILVEKDAQKTDAQLSNKNLVMADDAEIDTKPQLEIYADDVKCSHGTTVGKLDQNQLFYLRSRGINENDATRMLCLGFADQLISNIDDQALHDFIHQHIVGLFDLTLASNHE